MRAKKADVWISGDSDVILLAKRNESWAHVIDPGNPLDRRPNTLAVRYGDPEWKSFLDFYGKFLTINGEVERLFKFHMEKLGAACKRQFLPDERASVERLFKFHMEKLGAA